jgi:hypothetical protein
MTDQDKVVREELVKQLKEARAHASFEVAVRDLPAKLQGTRPEGADHSPWELLEHLRIAQWDILDFSRNPMYKELKWPAEYWPSTQAPPDEGAWEKSVESFQRDREELCGLIGDPTTDLFAPIAHGEGQTILREALLTADHNAYHIGQLILVRRLLGAWK